MIDYQDILNQIKTTLDPATCLGEVASYIPELAKVPRDKLGMHLNCTNSGDYSFGDSDEPFSIQSISKVFTLALAMRFVGEKLWRRVDVEPSGDPFNSLTQLEYEDGIPRNPFINAGALVVADVLVTHLENPKKELLEFVHQITQDTSITYDSKVAQSEKESGYRNVALMNYMKSFNNINNDVDEVLDFYYHQCALSMSCKQLSKAFMIFANGGKLLDTDERILGRQKVKRINALMQTCGFYDEAGEFSFKVGLPGKSGVGGGIVAVHPEQYSVAVWSPILNDKGNSELGMDALEELTTLTGLSIF